MEGRTSLRDGIRPRLFEGKAGKGENIGGEIRKIVDAFCWCSAISD